MQCYAHAPLSKRIVRTYSRPTHSSVCTDPRGSYHVWDDSTLVKAIEAKHSGLSYRRAAGMYGIPTSTLFDHITGKVEVGARPGPKPYLTNEEEEEVASFLVQTAKIGYPHTKSQVLALVQQIVNSKRIEATVTNGWWERFVERHPQLSLRTAVPLSLARAMATDAGVLGKYFDILEECLIQNGIFDKAGMIFNCDETGLPLNPKCAKVVDKTGTKNPSFVTGGDKSQVTVLACTSAVGYAIPPFVIFDRQSLNQGMTAGEVPGTLYGLSHNGWINSELFYHWFLHHFLQYAPLARPLMLLLDGHSSHYSPATIKLAAENQVIVFVLPPHTTHIAQPLDRGCFSPLKAAWRKFCHEFRAQYPGRVVTRYEFSHLFSKAWFEAMSAKNVVSSFKATGVCPFNRHILSGLEMEEKKQYASFTPQSLAMRTGLAYIPLYSPSCRDTVDRPRRASTPCRVLHQSEISLSDSEITGSKSPHSSSHLFKMSFDDISNASVPLRRTTGISKTLILPPHPSQIPTKFGKSSGRVLTSQENLLLLAEKERKKLEVAQKKEERKKEREERKFQREQIKLKKDQQMKCMFLGPHVLGYIIPQLPVHICADSWLTLTLLIFFVTSSVWP